MNSENGGMVAPVSPKAHHCTEDDDASESHRIYWQQWMASNETSAGSRREWITSSAAVRISPAARAADVTALLRTSLPILAHHNQDNGVVPTKQEEKDALVLVGTLYSLSRDFVRFTHEQPAHQSTGTTTTSHFAATSSSSSSSNAFHLVQTLQPHEAPLSVRDRMAQHLRHLQTHAVVGRTIIAPKLQWFYCPAVSSTTTTDTTMIPTCINLEGYCTSVEEEDDDWGYDDDDSDNNDSALLHPDESSVPFLEPEQDGSVGQTTTTVEDMNMLTTRFPWLRMMNHPAGQNGTSSLQPTAHASEGSINNHNLRTTTQRVQQQCQQEQRRFYSLVAQEAALAQSNHTTSSHRLSGYLLKRSHQDRHVWRRVHCVLTDDYLWFVSRRYTQHECTFAKHGRVRLTRALLLQPSVDYAPLYRTPYAFEMVAADGTSHIFRAANRIIQQQWIQAISDRIIQSFENSLIENAQLIVNDESAAQARRIDQAVDRLWDQILQQKAQPRTDECPSTETVTHNNLISSQPLGQILRWTLKLTEFRHFCRHVRSTLPAKSPVVVVSPSHTHKVPSPSTLVRERSRSSEHVVPPPLDPMVQSMIRATWQQAALLLKEATEVGQALSSNNNNSVSAGPVAHHHHPPHRSLETLLRHVEFLLTGRHRPMTRVTSGNSTASNESATSYQDRGEPPPMDLFDPVEKELHVLAATLMGRS